MNMKRREFITLVGVAAVMVPSTARPEQATKLPTIGYFGPARSASSFEHRLRELGWIAGRTVAIEYRSAEGDVERFTEIATEFVRLGACPSSRCTVLSEFDSTFCYEQVLSPVPVVNQFRTYWWCSPPRTGRQRMVPASLTARETGASFSKDKCVLISL